MRSFEINAIGLEHLNEKEARMTNGGSILSIIAVAAAVIAAVVLIAKGNDWGTDPNGNGFYVNF